MADPVSLGVTLALNAASMALTASQKIEGPRLQNLDVTQSDYGTPHNYFYGTVKLNTWVMWAEPIREQSRRRKTKGGKYNDYTYYGSWACVVALQEIDAVLAVYLDEHFAYNATGVGPISPFSVADAGSITQYMRIYLGTATQDPDPRILATTEANLGAGTCPAYRGCAYIVFEDLPLEKFGNRLPQVKVVATSNGGPTYPFTAYDSVQHGPQLGVTFSSDYSRVTWAYGGHMIVADVAAQAEMLTTDMGLPSAWGPGSTLVAYDQPANGKVYAADGNDILSWPADGSSTSPTVEFSFGPFVPLRAARALDYGVLGNVMLVGIPLTVGGLYHYVIANGVAVDSATLTGVDWIVTDAIKTTDLDVWAVGYSYDGSSICFYCLTDENGRVGEFHAIPGHNGGVYGFHTLAGGTDQFVVIVGEAEAVTVDRNSWTVTNVAPGVTHASGFPAQMRAVPPGATSFWVGGLSTMTEYSAADLSAIRSETLSNWNGNPLSYVVYDPLNNAFIGTEGTGGFGATSSAWYFLDRASGGGVQLSDIIADIAVRSGLDLNDIDASDCDQDIVGYSWIQGEGKSILEPLLDYYDSEVRNHDFGLNFRKRSGTSLGTIDVADMGASPDGKATRYTVSRVTDTDLPRRATVTFSDPYIGREPNTAVAQRMASTNDSSREMSLDMSTMVDEPVDARFAVDRWLRRQWTAAETYELSLTRAYSKLEPGDVYTLDLDSLLKTARLEQITFQADGVLACKWSRDGGTLPPAASQPGAPADGVVLPTIPTFGYSRGFVLDIPLVRDVDDGIITYVAAARFTPGTSWPGALVLESDDAGASYDAEYETVTSSQEVTWGTTSAALPTALTTVWDRASTVSVYCQSGSLVSATEAQVLQGANRALIGNEIVGFATATLTAPNTYTLSNFLRGRRGTEQHVSTHAAGDRFVLLDSGDLVRHPHGASDVGDTLYLKPTTQGSFNATGFPTTLAYSAASAKPYSPVHLEAEDVSGDKVLTWIRRTRIGGDAVYGTTPPLGETTEAYKVQILNAGGTVLRTYTPTSPTQTYDAADQATDSGLGVTARVMQVSSTVGDGFPSTVAL